jgi:serine phosphatase RsbU (regulator of sigma subunit)
MRFNKILLVVFLLLFNCSCSEVQKESPKAIKGEIDLREWDFQKDGMVNLSGKWEFYWEQLLTPEDFKNNELSPDYIYVPQGWGGGKEESKKYPDDGYATYRLKIKLPEKQTEEYRVLFTLLFSATKVYLNGELLTECGNVSKTKEENRAGSLNFDDYFNQNMYPSSGEIDLIIQQSNYGIKGEVYAGLISKLYVGTKSQIKADDNRTIVPALMVSGMLLIIGVYHLVLFFFQPKEYSTLVFAVLSLSFVHRIGFDHGLGSRFFIDDTSILIPMVIAQLMGYITLMATFFYLLFQKYFNKKLFYVILFISLIYVITPILFPFKVANNLPAILVILLFMPIAMIILNIVAFKAMLNKEQGAIWAFIGILISLLTNIHDVLIPLGGVNDVPLTGYGFAIYILFQAINIAERFSLAFKKNRQLNINLEKIVKSRTSKIEVQRDEILSQNEELKQQQEEVIMVNESLERQRLELQEKNTAITDSIQYARTIQKAILPTQKFRRKVFPKSFLIYRPKDIVSGDFFWIKMIGNIKLIACVDCTGHGVPGAFMSVIANNSLNDAIDHKQYKPSEILNYLGKNIPLRLNQAENNNFDGMDISICRFEELEGGKTKLLYAGAKSTIYLMQNDEMEIMKGDRKSIGGMRRKLDFFFQDFERELSRHDMIYMASDGYIDQANKEYKRFGSKAFRSLIKHVYKLPTEKQKELFKKDLDSYQGEEEQIDDITMIGIRV